MRFLKRIRIFRSKFVNYSLALIILIIIVRLTIKYHYEHRNQLPYRKRYLTTFFFFWLVSSAKMIYSPCLFFECSFEEWIVSFTHSASSELGNLGEPAYLPDDEKNEASEVFSRKAMNVVLSNKIPLTRTLPDVRDPL